MGTKNHIDLLGAAQVHPSLQYQSKVLSGDATTPLGLSNAILTRDVAWLNIFKNGGFQKWSNGTSNQPDNVVDIPGAGFSGSVARTTFAKNDNWFATPYSTIYTNDSGKAMGGQKTFTNLKAFTQYSVSIWVYTTTGSSPIYLQTTGAFTNIDENSDTRKDFWLRLVGTFTTDATPTDVIVKFYNSTSSGHFGYYSRLVIVEGDAPVEFSPHPADLGFEDFISSAGYSPANIIKNGSFQDWSNGTSSQPDEFVDEGTPTVARDTGERDNWFDTPYAVKYTATGADFEGGKVTLSNLKVNTFYAVSVRAKVTAGDTARLATTGAADNITEETTSTSWVTLSGIFRTDGTPTDVVLKLLARFDGDIVWFDKLIVVQGEVPLVFFPRPEDLIDVSGSGGGEDMRNLVVVLNPGTPATEVDIDADFLQVEENNHSSVNVTIDATGTGANGLDAGTLANDTWYSIWAIYNPTTDTVAGLASTSETAPTMPAGYTKKRKVGHVRTGGAASFNDNGSVAESFGDSFHERGDHAGHDFQVGALTTDGAWHDLNLSAIVPDGAKSILFEVVLQDNVSVTFGIRKNGNSNIRSKSEMTTQVANVSMEGNLTTICDSGRVIEYQVNNAVIDVVNLNILGWWR